MSNSSPPPVPPIGRNDTAPCASRRAMRRRGRAGSWKNAARFSIVEYFAPRQRELHGRARCVGSKPGSTSLQRAEAAHEQPGADEQRRARARSRTITSAAQRARCAPDAPRPPSLSEPVRARPRRAAGPARGRTAMPVSERDGERERQHARRRGRSSSSARKPRRRSRRACRTPIQREQRARPRRRRAPAARSRSAAGRRCGARSGAERARARRSRAAAPSARASSRLATLAQAISSTKPTAPSSRYSDGLTSPVICVAIGTTLVVQPVSKAGKLRGQARRDRVHLGLRLCERHAWRETGDDVQAAAARRAARGGEADADTRRRRCDRGTESPPASRRPPSARGR